MAEARGGGGGSLGDLCLHFDFGSSGNRAQVQHHCAAIDLLDADARRFNAVAAIAHDKQAGMRSGQGFHKPSRCATVA